MITFVTSNRHKYEEIAQIFQQAGLDLRWEEMKYEEIQADTNEEISRDSCLKLQNKFREDFFIEDTGLYIDDLNGFPGVYSSYVQATIGNSGIIRLMEGCERGAEFRAVITAVIGGNINQFIGVLRGSISTRERGSGGFGYDPLFVPEGQELTLSEMTPEEKNRISHRYRATQGLVKLLKA